MFTQSVEHDCRRLKLSINFNFYFLSKSTWRVEKKSIGDFYLSMDSTESAVLAFDI